MARPDRSNDLGPALTAVRDALAGARFPLGIPGADAARAVATARLAQLDDYLLPRLRGADAPLLAVVGGSTGAGKSTLVNSLVRAPVSRAGVIRPTTRTPLLVSNPGDTPWFADTTLLPSLRRGGARPGERSLQVVNAPALARGVALLDAPDIDSVVAANRELGRELLAAGDLWLFVTTAARYADAVPWQLLRQAHDRGTVVAIVLDRVPPDVRDDIAVHFGRMLAAERLGDAPLLVVVESTLDGHGLLPEAEVEPVKRWLDGVATSLTRRHQVRTRTFDGAVAALAPHLERLATAADDQTATVTGLAGATREAFTTALSDVDSKVRGGAVLRGEVHARWLDVLSSGDLDRALRSVAAARRLDGVGAGWDHPGTALLSAVAAALAALITEADIRAAHQVRDDWRTDPAGRTLLDDDPSLGRPWPGFADAAHDLVHGWQAWLRAQARAASDRVRTPARSFTTASTVLLATVTALAPPGDSVTATGAAATGLRAVLAEPATRDLGDRARTELLARVADLLGAEVDRHRDPLAALGVDAELAGRLRAAADRVAILQATTDRIGDAA